LAGKRQTETSKQISPLLSDNFNVELDVVVEKRRRAQHVGHVQFQQVLLSGYHQTADVRLSTSINTTSSSSASIRSSHASYNG